MVALISTLLACATVISAAPGLLLSLKSPNDIVDIRELVVQATLTNIGDETLRLLNNPNSILSTERTNSFQLWSSAGSPTFTGIRIKWSPTLAAASNDEAAYTILSPGQSVQIWHQMAGLYDFTRSGGGWYTVKALNMFDYVDSSGLLRRIQAISYSDQFQLRGLLTIPGVPLQSQSGSTKYSGCDASQAAAIAEAEVRAGEYIARANAALKSKSLCIAGSQAHLGSKSFNETHYTAWFGAYDKDRFSTVASHFEKMSIQVPPNQYDCGTCKKPSTYAYVYPSDQAKTIYLCPLFWKAGVDSRAGTIVHENAHFNVNGGAHDYAYGVKNSTKLAREFPNDAVMNSDNHEYFVETMI